MSGWLFFWMWVVYFLVFVSLFAFNLNLYQKMWHNVDLSYNAVKDPWKEDNIYDFVGSQKLSVGQMYVGSMNTLSDLALWYALPLLFVGFGVGYLYASRKT